MTNDVVEREKRRRATNREVLLTRAALKIVRPFNQQIGAWQASVARLTSMAERARAYGRDAPSQAVELEALEHMIAVHSERFADAVSMLSEDVRNNARVTDTRRALESLTAATQRAHALLGAGVGLSRIAQQPLRHSRSPGSGSQTGVFGPGSTPARG